MFPLLILVLLAIPFFLCWGSFLNVVACRLLTSQSLLHRSSCPSCRQQLAWYHLIPLVSWFFLRGRCAFCKTAISGYYPAIEVLTTLIFAALFATTPVLYLPAYFLFASALIVNMRTDSEHMLLLTPCTLGLIPFGLLAAATGFLPISFVESFFGVLLGGGILWLTRWIFWQLRGIEGMGWGDIELLAGIGSFVGPRGVVLTLLLGSISGSLIGLLIMATTKKAAQLKLPFGAFLSAGALIYCLFGTQLINLLW